MYVHDYEDFFPPLLASHPPPTDRWGPRYEASQGIYYLNHLPWHRVLWSEYLDKDTNIFQCAGNLPQLQRVIRRDDLEEYARRFVLPVTFNFAYGANGKALVSENFLPVREVVVRPSVIEFYSCKMTEISSPVDCVGFGDSPGWQKSASKVAIFPPWLGEFFGTTSMAFWLSNYTFSISLRDSGRSNMAFLDGHVEHGSLRDWTLPVSAVWNRWHHRNRWPVEEFQNLPADKWAPLYGADEFLPETSVDF